MAQTIDLPEAKADAAAPANADDLLSQLAGEEIDRLLAEAEVEKPPVRADPPVLSSAPQPLSEVASAAPVVAPSSDAAAASTIPEPVTPAPQAPASDNPAAAAAPHHAEAINTELDELFKELSSDSPTADKVSSMAEFDAIPEADPTPPPAAAVASPASPATKQVEQPTTRQEQAALKEASIADAHVDHEEESTSIPLYLKPLEWLNMPLQLVPEPARDLVGKVAIVTFMNALSVLAYLLIFRRH